MLEMLHVIKGAKRLLSPLRIERAVVDDQTCRRISFDICQLAYR